MKFNKSFLAAVLAVCLGAASAQADWQQGGGPGPRPGFGGPGGPGRGPGFGGPGRGPGFGGPGRGPGFGGPGRGPGFGGPGRGPGWGPPGHGPGWGHGPGRGPGWGHPPPLPPPPPPPPPPNYPPPSIYGLCQGNFSGFYDNSRQAYMSLNTNGYYVSATVYLDNPQENLFAQGTCQESNGYAQLNLQVNGRYSLRGQIYLASDGVVYVEATEDQTGQRVVLQRQ